MPNAHASDAIAVIPARGGSRGLPRKAELPVGGIPLLVRTILAARAARSVARVLVSTDDPRFAALASAAGADISYRRPAELATDTACIVDAVRDLLMRMQRAEGICPYRLVLLQPTSPFTTAGDIDGAARELREDVDAVTSVCPSEVHPDWLRRQDDTGLLHNWGDLAAPRHTARQQMPPALRLTGAIYWVRTAILLRDNTFLPERTRGFVLPVERSVDIDNPADLDYARYLAATMPHPATPFADPTKEHAACFDTQRLSLN